MARTNTHRMVTLYVKMLMSSVVSALLPKLYSMVKLIIIMVYGDHPSNCTAICCAWRHGYPYDIILAQFL